MARKSDDGIGCLVVVVGIPLLIFTWVYENIVLVLGIIFAVILLAWIIYALLTVIEKSVREAEERKQARKRFEEKKRKEEDRVRKENQRAKEKALRDVENIYEQSIKYLRDTKSIKNLEKLRQEAEGLILEDHLNAAGDIIKKIDERFSELQRDSGELEQIVSEVWPTRELNIAEHKSTEAISADIEIPLLKRGTSKVVTEDSVDKVPVGKVYKELFDCPAGRSKATELSRHGSLHKNIATILVKIASKCDSRYKTGCQPSCDKHAIEWRNHVGHDRNMISLDYVLNALIDCPHGREKAQKLSNGEARIRHYDFLRLNSMSMKCKDKGTLKCNVDCNKPTPMYAG